VTGPVHLPDPPEVEVVRVTTAAEMAEAVFERAGHMDVIVKSAAVADFKPSMCEDHKIKKGREGLRLELIKNIDILSTLGQNRRSGQLLVGFAAESRRHAEEGQRKLQEKNLDLIVVNDILGPATGFDVATNQVTLIDRQTITPLPLLSKEETADRIWDKVVALREK
jgi:phosphopantothenoylcysteine decarboxylase/phosphopantothenate--cysteine ligase